MFVLLVNMHQIIRNNKYSDFVKFTLGELGDISVPFHIIFVLQREQDEWTLRAIF